MKKIDLNNSEKKTQKSILLQLLIGKLNQLEKILEKKNQKEKWRQL